MCREKKIHCNLSNPFKKNKIQIILAYRIRRQNTNFFSSKERLLNFKKSHKRENQIHMSLTNFSERTFRLKNSKIFINKKLCVQIKNEYVIFIFLNIYEYIRILLTLIVFQKLTEIKKLLI